MPSIPASHILTAALIIISIATTKTPLDIVLQHKEEKSASEAWKKSLRVPDSKEFKELKYDYDWIRVQEEWKITLSSYGLTHLIDPEHIIVDIETD